MVKISCKILCILLKDFSKDERRLSISAMLHIRVFMIIPNDGAELIEVISMYNQLIFDICIFRWSIIVEFINNLIFFLLIIDMIFISFYCSILED